MRMVCLALFFCFGITSASSAVGKSTRASRTTAPERLVPACTALTRTMYDESRRIWKAAKDPGVQDAALKNVAYFGVAMRLLGLKTAGPPEAETMVAAELEKIESHQGRQQSAIFPFTFDFSQFVPRGQYAKSEKLNRYFRTMTWYGLVPMPLEWPEGEQPAKLDYAQIRQSLLITHTLYQSKIGGRPALETWRRLSEPNPSQVGSAGHLTPQELRHVAAKVYGKFPSPDELWDPYKLIPYAKVAKTLRKAQAAGAPQGDVPTGPQFRFVNPRALP